MNLQTQGHGAHAPQNVPEKNSGKQTTMYKRFLVGMLVVGALAAAASNGSFASFNATLTQTSGITTGVLVLGNKTDAAVECFSSGAAITTNSAACASAPNIFAGGIGSGTPQFHNLTLRNAGDLTNAIL